MKIEPFALERYFATHEFSARYLLSSSDCESLSLLELVEMAHKDRVELWIDLKLGYTESQGHPRLRQEIAGTYRDIDSDEILGVIPEEGIFLLMHALLEPGDHIVCTFPGYQSLYEIARSIGCGVSFWEPVEENGWFFDPQQLEYLVTDKTRLVVMNFPHNPTGYLPDREDYLAMLEIASKRGIHVLSDEMYRYLEVSEEDLLPAGCEIYERAISLSGLSKAYGLPGLRIGWTVSKDRDLLRRMMALKDYTTICASAPSEVLAIFALTNREQIIAQQRQRLIRNLELLDRFFDSFKDMFDWRRPRAGSIGFAKMKLSGGAQKFCEAAVIEAGIMIAPSTVFNYGDDHIRLGFGREDLPEVLDVFSAYLRHKYRGRTHTNITSD
ncbi:MAG: aminotransferase class I/II-fold pyridoxal phosphate-dependent enzyme [Candidatus Promineifilaceae bacterium]